MKAENTAKNKASAPGIISEKFDSKEIEIYKSEENQTIQ